MDANNLEQNMLNRKLHEFVICFKTTLITWTDYPFEKLYHMGILPPMSFFYLSYSRPNLRLHQGSRKNHLNS